MSDSKVYMFPESGTSNSGLLSMLAPLLSQRQIDPNMLLALQGQNGFGGEGGWFMWIIFLFFLMGWGGNGWGFGNRGGNGGFNPGSADLAALINNDNGRELLMSAIQGNGTAISQLASTLNCSIGNIQTAINGVMSQVQNVGCQVGMSGQQVINAIQSGNATLASQLTQCCCNIQDAITRQGYENQLATVNQTNSLINAGNANTTALSAKLDAMQTQSLYDKIDALREKNSTLTNQISQLNQNAYIAQVSAQTVAPVAQALATLQSDVNGIKCKLPETVSVPWPNLTAVQNIPVNYYGLNTFSTFGSCGCNNSLWG